MSLSPLGGVLQDIVIIGSEHAPRPAEPFSELGKIQVVASEIGAQGMIKIAAVYKYRYSIFHKHLFPGILLKDSNLFPG
jgi:hypothetical protein